MNGRTWAVASVVVLAGFGLSGCKKILSATGTGSGSETEYVFFDDFNRSDRTFVSETNYSVQPSAANLEISNQRARTVTGSPYMTYATPVTVDPVATTVKFVTTNTTSTPDAFILRTDAATFASALHYTSCGFNVGLRLGLYDEGVLRSQGVTSFNFAVGNEVTVTLTSNGASWTCTADDGTNTETLTYTDSSPQTVNYHLITISGTAGLVNFDDFGIIDVAASGR